MTSIRTKIAVLALALASGGIGAGLIAGAPGTGGAATEPAPIVAQPYMTHTAPIHEIPGARSHVDTVWA